MEDPSPAFDDSEGTAGPSVEVLGPEVAPAANSDPVVPTQPDADLRPTAPAYVYAIGRVRPQFPGVSVENEFHQALGMTNTDGLSDSQALHKVVSDRSNRYLARQLCWTMTIEGLEMYLLAPREAGDLDLLIEAVRPRPSANDIDVVVGVLGGVAPASICNGLQLPIVVFDQLYSFDREELLGAIPKPEMAKDRKVFDASSSELFNRVMELADNSGGTDEHRALNYLAVRSPAIYARTAQAIKEGYSLSSIETRLSRLSGVRLIVDVIFAFTNRRTDYTEKSFIRVDVTEEFPFVVTKLGPYYDR